MKKVLRKFKPKDSDDTAKPSRITNDTLEEHRQKIIADGRKFKYPVQYTRHRLVFNAIAIVVVVFVAFAAVTWWQLYRAQTTDTFFYRTARIVPLPVASVDGELVKYSDYLMLYRASEHLVRENNQLSQATDDRQRQLGYFKRSAMDQSIANTFAEKIAKDKGISVSEADVNDIVLKGRQADNGSLSQELYDASLLQELGSSQDELRLIIKRALLYSKVKYDIDDKAKQLIDRVAKEAKSDGDLVAVSKRIGSGVQVGSSGGFVKKTTQDGDLASSVSTLKPGQISDVIKSSNSDGYYIVRLDGVQDGKVSYSFLKVSLTEFDSQLKKLKDAGKVQEFINITRVQADSK